MKLRITNAAGATTVKLDGHVDESFGNRTMELRSADLALRIVFDCGEVKTVNSVGVGAWIALVRDLGRDARLEFVKCPASLVFSINMVPAMLAGGTVKSCFVPYRCAACKHAQVELLDLAAVDSESEFAAAACRKCAKESRAEVEPAEYLQFLNQPR